MDPTHLEFYAALQQLGSFTGNFVIKFDEKINSAPASDIAVEFRGDNVWKLIQLYGIGHGGPENTAKAYDSNNFGNALASWDVSIGVHHIEINMSPSANSPVTIKEDGKTLLNWTSSVGFPTTGFEISIFGTGSEFANFQLCDSSGCEAITPTPSATPTPTPIPITKVVMIPGFAGSWNADAILNCKSENYEGVWTSWTGSDFIYSPFLASLHDNSFTPKPFYYDWRKQIPDLQPLLTSFINGNVMPNEKVDVVGHSMGGLVGEAYIEEEGRDNKADKFVAVGTPHLGTILSYPAWSAGDIWSSLPFKILATAVVKQCSKNHPGLTDKQIVQQFMPSVQNLLPTFDYLKDAKTGTIKPTSTLHAQNNWLPIDHLFLNTLVGALSGFGFETLHFLDVINPNKHEGELGNWLDGKPTKKEYVLNDGDGTVLTSSSRLDSLGAVNRLINQDHLGLIQSQQGVEEIIHFLSTGGFTPLPGLFPLLPSMSIRTNPETALVIIGYPADFSLTISGKTIKDKNGILAIFNPKPGIYTLALTPKTANTKIIVGQFLKNDKTLWRQYQWNNLKQKIGTIQFDPDNPIEDILKSN